MAAQKSASKNPPLGTILKTVQTGFAAVAEDIAEVKTDMNDLKTEMMEQFDHVDTQFRGTDGRLRDLAAEVASLHRSIERLEEQGASTAGFAKEIDLAFKRIAAIEKHLGLHTSRRA